MKPFIRYRVTVPVGVQVITWPVEYDRENNYKLFSNNVLFRQIVIGIERKPPR